MEKFGETIDGAGVIVVIVGALIAFAGAVIGLTRHEADVYRRLRDGLATPSRPAISSETVPQSQGVDGGRDDVGYRVGV